VRDMLESALRPEGFGIPAADWQQPPQRVRLLGLTFLKRVEALATRLHQNASHARRPPSTEESATKRHRRMQAVECCKPGATPGHTGPQLLFLAPMATMALFPPVPSSPLSPLGSADLSRAGRGGCMKVRGWS
jgi:hypothetical protein